MEYLTTQPENDMINDTFEDAMTCLTALQKERVKVDQEKIALIRHTLAEEAEKLAHGATIIVTSTKLATGNTQLEGAEIAIASTSLALSFLHAAHHKYLRTQEQKHIQHTNSLA